MVTRSWTVWSVTTQIQTPERGDPNDIGPERGGRGCHHGALPEADRPAELYLLRHFCFLGENTVQWGVSLFLYKNWD